jgi:hypothetical protein
MKKTSVSLLISLFAVLALPAAAVDDDYKKPTIKKCQDATGKWHYGDSASEACAQSKITVMSEQGFKKKEIAAPLTKDELRRRDQDVAEQAKAQEQAKKDELLLATYANEADITYIRDRKLAQLESMIRASMDTLNPLRATLGRLQAQAAAEEKAGSPSDQTTKALVQTRQQIAKHEATIAQKHQEQEQVRTRADQELARYRTLKAQAAKPPTTSTAKP